MMLRPDKIRYIVSDVHYEYRDIEERIRHCAPGFVGYDADKIIAWQTQLKQLEVKYQALVLQELGPTMLLKLKLADRLGFPFAYDDIFPDINKEILFDYEY